MSLLVSKINDCFVADFVSEVTPRALYHVRVDLSLLKKQAHGINKLQLAPRFKSGAFDAIKQIWRSVVTADALFHVSPAKEAKYGVCRLASKSVWTRPC
jgi:hypothetical protein